MGVLTLKAVAALHLVRPLAWNQGLSRSLSLSYSEYKVHSDLSKNDSVVGDVRLHSPSPAVAAGADQRHTTRSCSTRQQSSCVSSRNKRLCVSSWLSCSRSSLGRCTIPSSSLGYTASSSSARASPRDDILQRRLRLPSVTPRTHVPEEQNVRCHELHDPTKLWRVRCHKGHYGTPLVRSRRSMRARQECPYSSNACMSRATFVYVYVRPKSRTINSTCSWWTGI